MNDNLVESLARAILYEGYLLYPYRPSALKNRQRFNFGVVYPNSYGLAHGESWSMQTECLATGGERMRVSARVRFLQLVSRDRDLTGRSLPGWQEAVEREVTAPEIAPAPLGSCESFRELLSFGFPRELKNEGGIVRRQESIDGMLEIAAERVTERLSRIRVRISNLTPTDSSAENGDDADRNSETMMRAFVSTHTILGVRDGEFISLLDPPEDWREAAAACRNVGAFPVLVGEEGDCLLSAPIILYDQPQIAPESAGDLFDGTEIDEILTLRILALSDDEKREIREGDERARQILERCEALTAEQLLKMHGALRR